MTYEELLAEIDRLDSVLTDSYGMSALRAVVELHKPIYRGCSDEMCCGSSDICGHCADEYPCETIQAIEKELG